MDRESLTKQRNKTRHQFLLTFFPHDSSYKVQEVNGYILVKQFNGANNEWEVAIYSPENWRKVEQWKRGREAESKPHPTA